MACGVLSFNYYLEHITFLEMAKISWFGYVTAQKENIDYTGMIIDEIKISLCALAMALCF